MGTVVLAPVKRVALSSGHHNKDGGNDYETETTGLLTPRIAAACRRLGMDVRVVQPEDGAGFVAGGIWDVARTVVKWSNAGWPADIFMETHTQGVADPTVRGVFSIYPDWPPDVDIDVIEKLGPDLARRISTAGGIPIAAGRDAGGQSTPGLLSERRTAVGAGGSRLGIFGQTASINQLTTRLLIEYGSHTNPIERALHRDPVWLDVVAGATAESFAAFLGLSLPDGTVDLSFPDSPWPTVVLDKIFVKHWRALEAALGRTRTIALLGYPYKPAKLVAGRLTQALERAVLESFPDLPYPYTVQHRRLGADWADATSF